VVVRTVSTLELDHLVQIYFRGAILISLFFFFLSDLRIAANCLVLHALSAYADSTLVLNFHRNCFLLRLVHIVLVHIALSTITMDDSTYGRSI